MASKEVNCPACKKPVRLLDAEFDKKLNLLCNHCAAIVFPVDASGDELLRRAFPIDTSSAATYTYPAKKEPVQIRVIMKDQK
jgi:hypothetical protein